MLSLHAPSLFLFHVPLVYMYLPSSSSSSTYLSSTYTLPPSLPLLPPTFHISAQPNPSLHPSIPPSIHPHFLSPLSPPSPPLTRLESFRGTNSYHSIRKNPITQHDFTDGSWMEEEELIRRGLDCGYEGTVERRCSTVCEWFGLVWLGWVWSGLVWFGLIGLG